MTNNDLVLAQLAKGEASSKELAAVLTTITRPEISVALGELFEQKLLTRQTKSVEGGAKGLYYKLAEVATEAVVEAAPPVADAQEATVATATEDVAAASADAVAEEAATPAPAAKAAPAKPAKKAAAKKATAKKPAAKKPAAKKAAAKKPAAPKAPKAPKVPKVKAKVAPPVAGINPDGTMNYAKLGSYKTGDVVGFTPRGLKEQEVGVVLYPEWSWWRGVLTYRILVQRTGKEYWKTGELIDGKIKKAAIPAGVNAKEAVAESKVPKYSAWKTELCLAALAAAKK